MGEHFKEFHFIPADTVTINRKKHAREELECDRLRIFKKMILDAETPITKKEIEHILEAAGF